MGTSLLAADVELHSVIDGRICYFGCAARERIYRKFARAFEPSRFEIFEQALASAFAAVTAFAIAAESTCGVEHVRAIDPDDASLQLRRNMKRHVDAFTPNARSQTISGIIRQFDRFFRRAECHGGEHGTKDFLLCYDRSGMHIA